MNFFQSGDIDIVSLTLWLDWAGGKTNETFVALPMIQRGSVWQPHQIIDLWDSLLQGMPIGSMMVSELPAGTPVRRPGKHEREYARGGRLGTDRRPATHARHANRVATADRMDQRVWIDFSDDPAPGQLLRLRVTTKNQPFGFQREPSRKLSLDDQRKAREAFRELNGEQIEPNLDNARPSPVIPACPLI